MSFSLVPASDLVANDSNGITQDVFLYDNLTKTVTLVSRNTGTGSGNNNSLTTVISGDGNFIAFSSNASDLVSNDSNGIIEDVFLFNRTAGTIALVSHNTGTGSGNSNSTGPTISSDGAFIAFRTAPPTW